MKLDKVYLPGLNGVRAIAASAVVFSHVNMSLSEFGMGSGGAFSAANFGVTIFFALSGFLITYLLLVEKATSRSIDIGKFYIRRILRIWPLYFLYLILVIAWCGISVLDHRLYWYLLFVPNVAFVIGQSLPLLAHYWSLGVEEQFYLIWPVVVKRINNLVGLLVFFIFAFVGVKSMVKILHMDQIYAFFHYSRFGCMAIGALVGIFCYRNDRIIFFMTKSIFQWFSWILLSLVAINWFHIASIIDHEIITLATVVLIVSQVKQVGIISLDVPWLNYLGRISYGMYVFNPLVISLFAWILKHYTIPNIWLKYMAVYIAVPLTVVIVSHVSYNYFERWFLDLKDRFSVVRT